MSFADQLGSSGSGGMRGGGMTAKVGFTDSPPTSSSAATIRANIARISDNIKRMGRLVRP